ncbi:hypothetical protein [Streptomyces sp. NPDC088766]|uniref:hypothetical protein n=1 Tax=Streptomyces sp. NPDC088766 TaxID=3365893 RepID=UPI0037F6263B
MDRILADGLARLPELLRSARDFAARDFAAREVSGLAGRPADGAPGRGPLPATGVRRRRTAEDGERVLAALAAALAGRPRPVPPDRG